MDIKKATRPPEMSLGDVIDRVTILTRKTFFGEEEAYEELEYLEKGLGAWGIPGKLVSSIVRLAQMNFEIWNLENEIRKGGEDSFSKEEIGCRAIIIRDLNRKRVRYKNALNQESGIGFTEFKIKHRSQ